MATLYKIIGRVPLCRIPEQPQSILKVWSGQSAVLDPVWLEGVMSVSQLVPDLRIRTAHLSFDRVKGPHRDGVPGFNLIWVHQGNGFYIENERVQAEEGDVVLFDRASQHYVQANQEYVRTVLTTIYDFQKNHHLRFLKDGIFYSGNEPWMWT